MQRLIGEVPISIVVEASRAHGPARHMAWPVRSAVVRVGVKYSRTFVLKLSY